MVTAESPEHDRATRAALHSPPPVPGLDPGSTFFAKVRGSERRWMPDQVRHDEDGRRRASARAFDSPQPPLPSGSGCSGALSDSTPIQSFGGSLYSMSITSNSMPPGRLVFAFHSATTPLFSAGSNMISER